MAAIAEGLREAGVAPGDRVALLAPEPPDFIAAAYACWVSGAVAVVVDRGLGVRGLARALRSAEPRWLLGTRKTLGVARALRWAPGARRLEIGALRDREAKLSAVVERLAPGGDAPAAVVFTSGATGTAKGVLYDQQRMSAQFEAVRACYGIGPADRLVAAFAPFALYGPALGIPVAVPDCDITKPASLRADALADACAAIDATIVFAAPAALDGVLATQEGLSPGGREALGALRLVLSAGAPVPQRILEAFGRLAPRAELHTPYGMTEALSIADIDLATLAAVGPGRGVCVGHPVEGVQVRIEPLDGGDGETGEIVVSAPWQSLGYDGLWATTDRARTVDEQGVEWHRTGDVGRLDADGRLWVEGRMAHVVATADGPVTPVPLEIAAEAATGLPLCGDRGRPAGLRAGRGGRRARRQGGARRHRPRHDGARSARPAGARRGADRSRVPRRPSPQLEDRPHAARPLGRCAPRRRVGAAEDLMRVLVTGGSGLLGRRTIAALAARGHEVVALQRRQQPGAGLPAGPRRRLRPVGRGGRRCGL